MLKLTPKFVPVWLVYGHNSVAIHLPKASVFYRRTIAIKSTNNRKVSHPACDGVLKGIKRHDLESYPTYYTSSEISLRARQRTFALHGTKLVVSKSFHKERNQGLDVANCSVFIRAMLWTHARDQIYQMGNAQEGTCSQQVEQYISFRQVVRVGALQAFLCFAA